MERWPYHPTSINTLVILQPMFVLLKILLFLFRPLIWVLILFAIAAFSKNEKRKKRFFKAGFLILLFFTNPFIIRKCIEVYETKPVTLPSSAQYNAGILLGGMVSYNRNDGNGYFNPAADRFIQTALLYKKGQINSIIVAAGNGYITKNNFREALFIKDRLITLGIPSEKIYTDTSSRNTLENALYSKKIIDSFNIPGPYLLISSAMHLPRAKLVFHKAGINAEVYPCDFISKRISNNFFEDYLLPSAYALKEWDNFIKEMVGSIAYKITGKG
jgi:uncharacterized SAM-binding protein YcdF (DUF218 family)